MPNFKNIHFIGIGGIGMSAIARMLKTEGLSVSGSDASSSDLLDKLKGEGIEIFGEHNASNIKENCECIVYTIAIPESNPELIKAKELGIPLFTYAQMLGQLSKDKFTIAVSGTHGKTTTTAMLASVFEANERDPFVIVGSILSGKNSNYIKGSEETFVVEACEYGKSFLNLSPNVLVITNIEEDHLDFYKDLEDIQNTFKELVSKVPADGFIICNTSDEKVKSVIEGAKATVIDYMDFQKDVPKMKVFGNHNVLNASASIGVSEALKLNLEATQKGLESFAGTWRRQEYIGKTDKGVSVYDDYAHHPTELSATIDAFKKNFSDKKIVVIFQPHLYSRTKLLFDDFVKELSETDQVILLPIYAAREKEDISINSEMLLEGVLKNNKNAKYFDSFDKTVEFVNSNIGSDSVVVTIGAGDVFKIGKILVG